MSDKIPPSNSSVSSVPRKQSRPGAVRSRTSPPPVASTSQNADGRPPTKRARKAINCEPCRNSKLKCDRSRPCSSCTLRGTAALCYPDGRGNDAGEPQVGGDDIQHFPIDPALEIARIRQSIARLESHISPHRRNSASHSLQHRLSEPLLKQEAVDTEVHVRDTAPGMLGRSGQGGLYAGPTSASTHLLSSDSRDSDDSSDRVVEDTSATTHEYDRDLLSILPQIHVIDGLIEYYFEYCNWVYRHVNRQAFMHSWERFKTGSSTDRVILSTACVIMAVAVCYLPQQHYLLETMPEMHDELGQKFYDVMRTALRRHQVESRAYTLDLVELLLARTHYLTLRKTDSEEIWSVKGELLTIGTAMGLHRDPGKWKMHRDMAERRRWAWWHIILLERWQAFMLGRPIAIASNHFDTQLPSYCSPDLDRTGRLYMPNIALFKLAYILGDIMNNAVSLKPVSYDSVLENDRALTQWMDALPEELDLDEFRIARNLASPIAAIRRIGVQSVIIRTAYHHIRFTLHRPYVSATKGDPQSRTSQSLDIAVSAADKLITMVCQAHPDFLANTSLSVPGHMNWGAFHCFSAAMFFSFQLIANPEQPGAGLFRANIRKAIGMLEGSRSQAVADKAYNILQALVPLHSGDLPDEPAERERKKAAVLGTVRKLAFPYHDSPPCPRPLTDSPGGRLNVHSPVNSSSSLSPGMGMAEAASGLQQSLQQEFNLPPMSSLRTLTNQSQQHLPSLTPYTHPPPPPPPHLQHTVSMSHSHQQQSLSNPQGSPPTSYAPPPRSYGVQGLHQQNFYSDNSRFTSYAHSPLEEQVWGASIGFGQGEWAQFVNGMRSETLSNL